MGYKVTTGLILIVPLVASCDGERKLECPRLQLLVTDVVGFEFTLEIPTAGGKCVEI